MRRPAPRQVFQNAKERVFLSALLAGLLFGTLAWIGFIAWLAYRGVRWAMGVAP